MPVRFHFARAGELPALEKIAADFECVTTQAVRDELTKGVAAHPSVRDALELRWLNTVPCDELDVLYLFAEYHNRLGNSARNAGESSVLAWAEARSAAVYIDDQVACNVGRSRGVRVHRTLKLVISAFRNGIFDEQRAQALIVGLADSDARFPREARQDLFAWARSQQPPLI